MTALRISLALAVLLALDPRPAAADDGEIDPDFGGDGLLSPQAGEIVADAAILPDQRLVVAGTFASAGATAAIRIVDDSPDNFSIFQCDEAIPLQLSFTGRTVLAPQAGGVLVGGSSTITGWGDRRFALLARFALPSCELDEDWSGSGWEVLDDAPYCDVEDCSVVALAESDQEPPREFALVESHTNAFASRYFVLRFTASGAVDTAYGDDGYAEVTASGFDTLAGGGASFDVDSHGRAVVGATRFDPDVSLDLDPFVLRLTLGGSLDTAFRDDGVLLLDDNASRDHRFVDLALTADGTLWTAHLHPGDGFGPVSSYSRIPDSGGWLSYTEIGGVRSIAAQGSDNAVVAYDWILDGFNLSRVQFYPALDALHFDSEFGEDALASFDIDEGGANADSPSAVVLSAGRPVVAGNADIGDEEGFFALRLLNAYVFADGFETGGTNRWLAP